MSITYTYDPTWVNRDALPDSSPSKVVVAADFEAEWIGIQAAFALAAPAADPTFTGTVNAGAVIATSFAGDGSALTGTASFVDADVDAHLNTGGATADQVLSWDGADYVWVADVDTHLDTGTATADQVLSWTGTVYDWVDQTAGLGIDDSAVATAITIDAAGLVGINAPSPDADLYVKGSAFPAVRIDGSIKINKSDTETAISGSMGIGAVNDLFYIAATDGIRFNPAGTEAMRITSSNELMIAGTTDQGAYNLQVNGTGVWGAGAYVNGSDSRWKDNITAVDADCLSIVNNLRPVHYTYNQAFILNYA